MIKAEDGKFCLYSKDGEKLGCFPTKEMAEEHEGKGNALLEARQSYLGIVTTPALKSVGVEWPLDKPTDISLLIDNENFRFAAAYGDLGKLFTVDLRQDTFQLVGEGDKQGREWEVCIVQEGLSKPSEGNPPIYWPPEVLADSDFHRKLENAPVRIYSQPDGTFNHAPLAVIDQAGHKLTGNVAGMLSNVRYGEFNGPGGGKYKGTIGTLHVTMSDVSALLKKAWELGKKTFVGLSVDTNVLKDRVRNAVQKVNQVKETTIVTHPAAGGWLLALRASAQDDEVKTMQYSEKVLSRLKETKPELYEKFMAATTDEAKEAIFLEAFQTVNPAPVVSDAPPKESAEKESSVISAAALPAVVVDALPSTEETKEFVRAALATTTLPESNKNYIIAEFDGRGAKPTDVMRAIARMQSIAGANAIVKAPLTVAPETSVQAVVTQQDKYNDAMMGLWTGRKVNNVPPFESIRQAYYAITGTPYTSNGAIANAIMAEIPYTLPPRGLNEEEWYPRMKAIKEAACYGDENLRQSTLQTSSFTIAFGNTMNRYMLAIYLTPDLQEYRKILSRIDPVNDFQTQTFLRIGGYSNLPTVSEGSTYTSATHPTEESVSYALVKRGELAFFTWESFVNDNIGAIKQMPEKIMRAAAQTRYEFYMDFLRSPGTWAPDSTAIFHANHGNLGSTAFSTAALDAAILAMRAQTERDNSKKISLTPKIVVYPDAIDRAVQEVTKDTVTTLSGRTETLANYLLRVFNFEGIRASYLSDANDWYLLADPTKHDTIIAGFFGGRDVPEMWFADTPQSYHMFASDKVALKIRDIYGGTYGDYRSLYKAVVT